MSDDSADEHATEALAPSGSAERDRVGANRRDADPSGCSFEPINVAPNEDEEDSSHGGWDRDGGRGRGRASGYRFLFGQCYRGRAMAPALAIIFLVGVFLGTFLAKSFSGKDGRPAGEAAASTPSDPGDPPAPLSQKEKNNGQPSGEGAMSTGSDPGDPSAKGTPLLAPVVKTEALNKKDIAVLTYMDPRWYGREDGYKGTTHQEAVGFCMSRDPENLERELCPPEAYCPNGSPRDDDPDPRPLVFKTSPFPREQWAATALSPNSWILIGTLEGAGTCEVYHTRDGVAQPLWGLDGTRTEIKQHVLCCKSPDLERQQPPPAHLKRQELPHLEQQELPPAQSNSAGSGNVGRVRFSILLTMAAMEGIPRLTGAR